MCVGREGGMKIGPRGVHERVCRVNDQERRTPLVCISKTNKQACKEGAKGKQRIDERRRRWRAAAVPERVRAAGVVLVIIIMHKEGTQGGRNYNAQTKYTEGRERRGLEPKGAGMVITWARGCICVGRGASRRRTGTKQAREGLSVVAEVGGGGGDRERERC